MEKEIIIKIPENATNGDVMKLLFPEISRQYNISGNPDIFDKETSIRSDSWWDEQYRR